MPWAVETVRNDGAWTPLWASLVIAVLAGSQILWWLALWLPLRWAAHGTTATSVWAVLWCIASGAADTLRQLGWAGNAYGGIGVALIDAPGVSGWLPVIGAQGVSLLAMACAGTLAALALMAGGTGSGRRWVWRQSTLVACLAAAFAGSGSALASIDWTTTVKPVVQAVAIQGNFDKREPWSIEHRDAALDRLEAAMLKIRRGGMVVTPETYLAEGPPKAAVGRWAELLDQVDRLGVHVLVGMPNSAFDEAGRHQMNTVVHLAPQRQSIYAKERLVPGFEYLPWPERLGPLYRRVFDGVKEGQMAAPQALTAPLYAGGVVVGVSICFEQAFALTMAERARDATVLVSQSEDAWIPSAAYRAQMLSTARLRAMEFGKPLLRVSNGGSSVAIDAHGVVQAAAPARTDALLVVELVPREGRTPYQQAASWIAAAPVALWGVAGIGIAIGRRSRRRVPDLSPITEAA